MAIHKLVMAVFGAGMDASSLERQLQRVAYPPFQFRATMLHEGHGIRQSDINRLYDYIKDADDTHFLIIAADGMAASIGSSLSNFSHPPFPSKAIVLIDCNYPLEDQNSDRVAYMVGFALGRLDAAEFGCIYSVVNNLAVRHG